MGEGNEKKGRLKTMCKGEETMIKTNGEINERDKTRREKKERAGKRIKNRKKRGERKEKKKQTQMKSR